MEPDEDRIDDAVLALLHLTRCGDYRSWKRQDRDVLDRLYEKGMIDDPKNEARSVFFTPEGWERSEELFRAMFMKSP